MIKQVAAGLKENRIILYSYIAAFIMYVLGMIIIPGFGVGAHFGILIRETSLLGIMAFGQSLVILTGGIDLSTPWTMTSAAVLLTYLSKGHDGNLYWIIPLLLLIGALIGLVNGFVIAYLRVPPIIMTMGMNQILQGALLALLRGAPGGEAPKSLYRFMTGKILQIPTLLLLWVIIIVLAYLLQAKSSFGRKLYAVGNNKRVAWFSGVNVNRTITEVYMLSGMVTAFAGICFAGRLGKSYLGMGDPYQFMTVVCVVLGGASMAGGRGKYIGTVAGTFILETLTVFLASAGFATSVQQVLYGIILVISVIAIPDSTRKLRI